MRTIRFMVDSIPAPGQDVALDARESRHAARVMRLRAGDAVVLLDGKGTRCQARVSTTPGRQSLPVRCEVVSKETLESPSLQIRLFIAPPRPKPMARFIRYLLI